MVARKKAKANASGAGGLRGFYAVLAVVALVGIVAIGYAMRRGTGAATEPVELTGVEDPRALFAKADGVVMGDTTAPVKIVEFGDFQCPACSSFALRTKPAVVERFVKTGRAQFIFYDFPLTAVHAHSFLASRAARCAEAAGGPDAFWAYHDLLFSRQAEWSYERGAPIGTFTDYAEQLGLDRDAFQGCLESDRYADVVSANRMLGEQLGVTGTPTLIIDNRRVRNFNDIDEIAELIGQEPGA
ncbi:MAG TPA: DsbA family protein [Longimicrobiales bacterium]